MSRQPEIESPVTNSVPPGRRLRAKIIGLGIDSGEGAHRILQSRDCFLLGGSDATRDDMLEMVLRLESELERIGRRLEELSPVELAEIGWRIDAPELVTAALRLDTKLRLAGRNFLETSAAELTRMASVDSDLD